MESIAEKPPYAVRKRIKRIQNANKGNNAGNLNDPDHAGNDTSGWVKAQLGNQSVHITHFDT